MNKKGFTLTEVLIVMIVAGILLAMILPNTFKAIERANVTDHRNNINSINTAIQMCFAEEQDWTLCDTEAELTDDNNPFIEEWPTNPFGGSYQTEDHATFDGKQACANTNDGFPADISDLECAG